MRLLRSSQKLANSFVRVTSLRRMMFSIWQAASTFVISTKEKSHNTVISIYLCGILLRSSQKLANSFVRVTSLRPVKIVDKKSKTTPVFFEYFSINRFFQPLFSLCLKLKNQSKINSHIT